MSWLSSIGARPLLVYLNDIGNTYKYTWDKSVHKITMKVLSYIHTQVWRGQLREHNMISDGKGILVHCSEWHQWHGMKDIKNVLYDHNRWVSSFQGWFSLDMSNTTFKSIRLFLHYHLNFLHSTHSVYVYMHVCIVSWSWCLFSMAM